MCKLVFLVMSLSINALEAESFVHMLVAFQRSKGSSANSPASSPLSMMARPLKKRMTGR